MSEVVVIGQAQNALMVFTEDRKIRRWLMDNDPMALEQAERAIAAINNWKRNNLCEVANMEKIFDSVTKMSRKALDIIFIKYKIRTSLGVVVGNFIYTLQLVLKPILQELKKIDLLVIKYWQFVIIGILFLHIPTIFSAFSRKPLFDENIEKLFASARAATKEGDLTTAQTRMVYINICNQVLKNVTLNEETKQTKDDIERELPT